MGEVGARIPASQEFLDSLTRGLNATVEDEDFSTRRVGKYSTVYTVFFTDGVTGRRLKTEFTVEIEDLEPFVLTEIRFYIESLTRTFIRQRLEFERAFYVKS